MHILIGNTVSNNQPHEHISFNLIVANTNELTVKGRWEQILSRCNDFTALVETHCTEHMQKSLPFVAKDFHILWGAPIKQGARTGVAALVKKGCCWNTKIVSLTNSPCEKYFNIGRLLLVQLFYGKGNRSILTKGLFQVLASWTPETPCPDYVYPYFAMSFCAKAAL